MIVDQPAATRALAFMGDAIRRDGMVPSSVLTWQAEHTRFAFQNGDAMFMRNWPYAWWLLQDGARSRVANRFAVAPFPAEDGGRPAAALGGAQLAVNAWSAHPALEWAFIRLLTAPDQMLERARFASQLHARRSLSETTALAEALPMPIEQVRDLLDAAVPRPVTLCTASFPRFCTSCTSASIHPNVGPLLAIVAGAASPPRPQSGRVTADRDSLV